MELFLALGAVLAGLGVVLGAFGAHALKDKFASPHYVMIWGNGCAISDVPCVGDNCSWNRIK